MKSLIKYLLLAYVGIFISQAAVAQGHLEYEHIGNSTLSDYWGNRYGSGDLQKVSISYSFSLPHKWNLTAYADYITMNNQNEAIDLNVDHIANLGLNFGYLHRLSSKWNILATFGAGVFAPTNEVSLKSILGSCGAIFVCRINDNLDLGGGIGLSNAYGIPMVTPMLYLNWHKNGRFSFNIDMSSGISVGSSMKIGEKFMIDLTALRISGISAVREKDGRSKIYSQLSVQSSLAPTWLVSKTTSVYIGVGGSWARSISETDRTIKAFFKGFSEEHRSKDFGVALRLNAGIRWKF